MLVRVNLELNGHEVTLAADGDAGLVAIERDEPDLVLLDAMMPVLDGWAVLAMIETWPLESRPPVVVVSAKSGRSDIQRALQLGATDFVAKPFEIADLLKLVGALAGAPIGTLAAHRAARLAAL